MPNEESKNDTISEKIQELDRLIKSILKEGGGKFTQETCPIGFDEMTHYRFSQMLNGLGCWGWNCPFCDESFES